MSARLWLAYWNLELENNPDARSEVLRLMLRRFASYPFLVHEEPLDGGNLQ